MIEPVLSLRLIPWQTALDIRALALAKGGADGIAALEWFVSNAIANPGATQTQTQTAWATFASSTGNMVDGPRWIAWAIQRVPSPYAKTWTGLKQFLASKSLATWQGQATIPQDGWRVSGVVSRIDLSGLPVVLNGDTEFESCPTDAGTLIIRNGFCASFTNICGDGPPVMA